MLSLHNGHYDIKNMSHGPLQSLYKVRNMGRSPFKPASMPKLFQFLGYIVWMFYSRCFVDGCWTVFSLVPPAIQYCKVHRSWCSFFILEENRWWFLSIFFCHFSLWASAMLWGARETVAFFLDMSQKNISSIQFQKFNTTNIVWT